MVLFAQKSHLMAPLIFVDGKTAYIRYEDLKHAKSGISNGISLHSSGLVPFAVTFSDYMQNAMRLSALSRQGPFMFLLISRLVLVRMG